MKKMISALLSCAILLPLMAACEGSTPSSTTEGNTESPVVTTTPITTVEEPSSQTLVIHTIGELNTT